MTIYHNTVKNVILAIAATFCLGILRGQNIPYKLYTPQDGLAQSQVTCIFQDSRGYIWVGTKGGISYFNGTRFQSLTPKDSLPSPLIGQVQEDAKGNIWFTCGRYFCKYDGERVTYDTANVRASDGKFFIDSSQTAWCLRNKDKLLYSSKDFKNWTCVSDKDKNLANKKWIGLAYDKKKERLLLRDINLYVYAYEEGNLTPISKQKGAWVQHYQLRTGAVDYATSNDSIFQLKGNVLNFIKKTTPLALTDVICRPNGQLYFLTMYGKNLNTFNAKNGLDTFPLNVSSTTGIMEDKDKNVWVGTEEGLMRVYLEGFKNFKKEDLGGVWSMVEDAEGGMWFGDFFKHKLHRYDGKKIVKKTIDYAIAPAAPKGDFGDFYFGGARDKSGNLYFSSNYGIKKWDGKRFSLLSPFKNDGHDISMHFYLDTVRNIIVSGTTDGFNISNLKDGKSKFYGAEKGVYCVKTGQILGTTKDKEGRYWLSTGYGVSVFDFEKDTVSKTYTPEKKNFPYYGIFAIFGDVKGTIWAGSSQGLLRFDAKGDTFALVAKNIIRSCVNAIQGYKDQYLVVGATDGIYFLDLKAFYTEGGAQKEIVRCFNQHNGYLGIEPNQNCLYVDSKDNVWVAASDIVTKITPSELNMAPQHLTPYITTINNKRIPYESYQQIISLPYGENTPKIFFEAVGFERPFNTEFQYKLDSAKWSEWRTEDFAVLDNLSSGVYTFAVRTRPAGTVNERDVKETSVKFRIKVPFTKEGYFPFLAFMLTMGFIVGGLAYFKTQKQRANEAQKQHDLDIDQRKTVELLNIEMAHRVKNNLTIMGSIMRMQSFRAKSEETKKVLKEGVDRLQAMATLHNHLVEKNGVESLAMGNYIRNLCEDVKKSYSDYAKGLNCIIDIGDIQLSTKFGRDIGLIVSELLTNSIKHAFADQDNPRISISLSETTTSILLVYQDNGCGISPNFDILNSNSLGLKLIQIIAEKFKGKVKVENSEGLHCLIDFEKKK